MNKIPNYHILDVWECPTRVSYPNYMTLPYTNTEYKTIKSLNPSDPQIDSEEVYLDQYFIRYYKFDGLSEIFLVQGDWFYGTQKLEAIATEKRELLFSHQGTKLLDLNQNKECLLKRIKLILTFS